MVNGVNRSSLLQTMGADKAFKNTVKYSGDIDFESVINGVDKTKQNVSDKTFSQDISESQEVEQINSNKTEFKSSLLEFKKDVVNDFKQFVDKTGKFNVNDEDIDYALRYGASILVDRRA